MRLLLSAHSRADRITSLKSFLSWLDKVGRDTVTAVKVKSYLTRMRMKTITYSSSCTIHSDATTGRPLGKTKCDGPPASLLILEIFITRVLPDSILAATCSFAIINKKKSYTIHHNTMPLCRVINWLRCNRIIRNTTHIIPLKLSYLCKPCNAGDVESPEICEDFNIGLISEGDTL